MISNCQHCGNTFALKINIDGTPHKRKWNVCSGKCASIARKRSEGVKPRHIRAACVCRHCHKTYKPKHKDRVHYCSRECYFLAIGLDKQAPYSVLHFNQCRTCDKRWTASSHHAICSRECELEDGRRKSRVHSIKSHIVKQYKCKQCNLEFNVQYGSKRTTFCSDKCGRKHGRISNGSSNNAQRAKKLGLPRQYFNEVRVLDRDRWRCQLCGVSTPKTARGKHLPNSPEVDHIIPLSQGGGHVWTNVQCACRQCNINKGSKALGQLLLFGEYQIPNRINDIGGGINSPQELQAKPRDDQNFCNGSQATGGMACRV